MVLDWRRALAVAGLSAMAQGCEFALVEARRDAAVDAANVYDAGDTPPVADRGATADAVDPPDAALPTDVDERDAGDAIDAGYTPDAGVAIDAPLSADVPDAAPPWPEDAPRPSFVMGRWGLVPSGGPPLRPFLLPLDVGHDPRVAVDPAGRAWLANATVARTRRFDRRELGSLLTLLDADGAIVARHDADHAYLDWIEADTGGATVALGAIGPARVGDLTWTADAEGEGVIIRFDARGARRWWARLPGATVLRGAAVVGDRVSVVIRVARAARVGDLAITGPRLARVDFDDRGAIAGTQLQGVSAGIGLRARPLADGGATVFEESAGGATLSAFSAAGVLRWQRTGRGRGVILGDDGEAWLLTPDELLGIDQQGSTRWEIPTRSFQAIVRDSTTYNLGRWLVPMVGAVGLVWNLRVDPHLYALNRSPCYPPPASDRFFRADLYTRDGREVSVSGGSSLAWSNALDVALIPGRVCTIAETWRTSVLSSPEIPAVIACDGIAPASSCTVDGFCGACNANLLTDPSHCGACDRRCGDVNGTLGRCIQGVCVYDRCDATHADCDARPDTGCEVDLARDAANCGACGNACPAGVSCDNGRCAGTGAIWWSDGRDGDFAPTRDTVLPSGVHRFRAITVPAGVTVRTTSDGVLDLRATGDVRIAGTIDLSGGDGEGASPLAAGGSTAGAPRGAAGSRGAGPAGGGGRSDPDGAGLAPGRVGPRRIVGLGVCRASALRSCHGTTTMLGELPIYDGDTSVVCSLCTPVGTPESACSIEATEGGGGGGSIGERALFDLAVAATFTPGSGGGASGNDGNGAGGAGGGALRISSPTRIVLDATASLLARGGRGGVPEGGPGSGGVIVLAAPEVRAAMGSRVSAAGGGTNGLGRVRVTADAARCTLAGSFVPPLRDGCAPTNVMGFAYVSAWR